MRRLCLTLALLTAAAAAAPAAHAGDAWDAFVRQYVQRLDGISPEAGDAEGINTVTHMIDPWPPYVSRRHIDSNGARMADVIERYRDVRKLPLAPPPIAPIDISPSGLSGTGGAATSTTSAGSGPAAQ